MVDLSPNLLKQPKGFAPQRLENERVCVCIYIYIYIYA